MDTDLWSPGCRLPGRRLEWLPQGGPHRDETQCWNFKASQPHNLQKSLGTINRPQIESEPFIFQVLCEKEKKKSTKMPGLLFIGLEETVTFNLTLSSLRSEHEGVRFFYLSEFTDLFGSSSTAQLLGSHLSSKVGLGFPSRKGGQSFSEVSALL